jgi:hypothetical protein
MIEIKLGDGSTTMEFSPGVVTLSRTAPGLIGYSTDDSRWDSRVPYAEIRTTDPQSFTILIDTLTRARNALAAQQRLEAQKDEP